MSENKLLVINNISVVYSDVIQVLKGVSLTVEPGQVVSLLGSNGAGKTTTLKAISGLLKPENGEFTEGSILFDGKPIHNHSPETITRAGIIQVLEGRQPFKYLTIKENLRVGTATRWGKPYRQDLDKVYHYFPALTKACQRLADGRLRTVDMIRVTVDGETHIFDNSAGIGFDADVLLEARKMKRLRGFLMYLWAVFRVLATGSKWPYPMRITVDGKTLPHQEVTLITVANGPRACGGFYLTPDARPDDVLFDVCVADQLGRWGILQLLPHAMKGTHKDKKPVTMLHGRHVLIEGERGLPGHVDGEVLCTGGRRIEFEILPGRLKVWC